MRCPLILSSPRLARGGGLLVLIGGIALWLRKRRGGDVEEADAFVFDDEELASDTEDLGPGYVGGVDEPVAGPVEGAFAEITPGDDDSSTADMDSSTADISDSTAFDVATPSTSDMPPEDDPLAEVNVYLAYERHDQAEGIGPPGNTGLPRATRVPTSAVGGVLRFQKHRVVPGSCRTVARGRW